MQKSSRQYEWQKTQIRSDVIIKKDSQLGKSFLSALSKGEETKMGYIKRAIEAQLKADGYWINADE